MFDLIPRSTKTHPGPVVHLSDRPRDEAKVSAGADASPTTILDPMRPLLT